MKRILFEKPDQMKKKVIKNTKYPKGTTVSKEYLKRAMGNLTASIAYIKEEVFYEDKTSKITIDITYNTQSFPEGIKLFDQIINQKPIIAK